MLVFDAIIGNNDRHFYNWGVIVNIEDKQKPKFSPLFDTARGLFWNILEEKLLTVCTDSVRETQYLQKYINKATPKITWEGNPKVNHIQLIQLISEGYSNLTHSATQLFDDTYLIQSQQLLAQQFRYLLPLHRRKVIEKYLLLRYEQVKTAFFTTKSKYHDKTD